MDTPTTGGACENGNPQVGAQKTKRRRPFEVGHLRKKPQWLPMTRSLPEEALQLARANSTKRARSLDGAAARGPAPEQPMPRTPADGDGEPNATKEPERRLHRAQLEQLPNLPEPWIKETDRIGLVDKTPGPDGSARRAERPLRAIVCSGPKNDIFSLIAVDPPTAKKTVKYGNKYTPSQKMRAAEYSRANGYHTPEGAAAVRPGRPPHVASP